MFKFLERGATIRTLVYCLSAYNPFRPYDNSNYSYHFKENLFYVTVKFPYKEEIDGKYTLIYNTDTTEFDIEPYDLKIKTGTFAYRRLKKALKIACGHSVERTTFYNMVSAERKKMAKYITTELVSSSSGDYNNHKRKHSSRKNTSCNPSIRDAVWSSSDDSSRSDSRSSSGTNCD